MAEGFASHAAVLSFLAVKRTADVTAATMAARICKIFGKNSHG